jgi:hypothetical protein
VRKRIAKSNAVACVLALASPACLLKPNIGPPGEPGPLGAVGEAERLGYIRHAQVWHRTDVSAMDLARGPQGAKSFTPFQTVTCDYVDHPRRGTTPKFHCALAPGDVVKVKYGRAEGKVYAQVVATRLFWALGFGTNAEYRVTVQCRNCPADPWKATQPRLPLVTFEYAMVERELPGEEIAHKPDEGWAFKELSLVDESQGGASAAQRDALLLLAAFVQHSDNSPNNQRLLCVPEGVQKDPGGRTTCTAPFMYIEDLGSTFGRGNFWHQTTTARGNYREWSRVPMWEGSGCRAHLKPGMIAPTLKDPVVSEAGRRFLADLLAQLTDAQIRGMFAAGTIDKRGWPLPRHDKNNGTLEEWVQAFKRRRDEVVNHHCSS